MAMCVLLIIRINLDGPIVKRKRQEMQKSAAKHSADFTMKINIKNSAVVVAYRSHSGFVCDFSATVLQIFEQRKFGFSKVHLYYTLFFATKQDII